MVSGRPYLTTTDLALTWIELNTYNKPSTLPNEN